MTAAQIIEDPRVITQVRLILKSFRHWTGRDLLPSSEADSVRRLFEAPFVVVSHGVQADPILNYGNASALTLWEMSWEDLIQTPSRLTAESVSQEERTRLLEQVTQKGFIDDYQGVRISKTGRRFRIEKAIVWNLKDEEGRYAGQAATFDRWRYL